MTSPEPGSPSPAVELTAFPQCAPEEPDDLRDVRVVRARLSVAEQLDGVQLLDAELVDCDVSGLVARRSRAKRVLVRETRLRAVTWIDGILFVAEDGCRCTPGSMT